MELLVYGNFTLASALSLVSTVERILVCNMNSKPLSHEEKSRKRSTIQLPSGLCRQRISPESRHMTDSSFFFDRFGYITLCNKTCCIFLCPQRDFYLTLGCSYIHSAVNDIHPSSCVYNYYQLGADNPRSAVLLELVHQIIKESCFDQLR